MGCVLNYTRSVTGDCSNNLSGAFSLDITGSAPGYTIQWISPYTGTTSLGAGVTNFSQSGLTAGTYSLTVVDDNGCSLTRTTSINCYKNYASYQSYVMGAEVFNVSSPTKFGMLQMLNEGFYDLTTGNTSCNLVDATYTAKVSVNPAGIVVSQPFFTSTSLVQAPSDNLWYNTIKSLLLSIPGIGNVTINQLNNQITIETSKNNTSLQGQEIVIDLIIVYDIMCLS
jgi:hypothetical protein